MKVVVLTGAGISAESGLATFRDADGLWEGHHPEDVATPQAFRRDRTLVQRFYDERRASLARVRPNAAHAALARLEQALGDDLLLVTQNVDDLHERGGSRRVLHMHGELRRVRCQKCEARHEWEGALADEPRCPACNVAARCGPTSCGSASTRTAWTRSTRRSARSTCSPRSAPPAWSTRPRARPTVPST